MLPSSVRTATAHEDSPRIITPSTTACPPMYRGCVGHATLPSGLAASGELAFFLLALADLA